jgi:hypothetical protein
VFRISAETSRPANASGRPRAIREVINAEDLTPSYTIYPLTRTGMPLTKAAATLAKAVAMESLMKKVAVFGMPAEVSRH